MTPERWQQVKELFNSALQYAPSERRVFLGNACSNDVTLLREVESLIDSLETLDNFIEIPACEMAAGLLFNDLELRPGTIIGHYEIRSILGKGGMGEVYLAQDTKLRRKVALKILPSFNLNEDEARGRLLREAQTAATLEHPNICTIYEVDESEGCSFIAMQYIEGQTLSDKLKLEGTVLRDAVNIGCQVADALSEAHKLGVVHRDIKPSNLIITPRQTVKVLDFGVAKFIAGSQRDGDGIDTSQFLSTPGTVIGTLPYMSPEQVRGDCLDGRSDIYSLGVVLYEMLSGHHPFARETQAETVSAILTYEPPFNDTVANAPAKLLEITRKCLAKNEGDRYQTADNLLIDLRFITKHLETSEEFESVTLAKIAQNGKQTVPDDFQERVTQKKTLPNKPRPAAKPRRAIITLISALVLGLLAAAAGLILFRARNDSIVFISVERTAQLTDWPGLDDFPAISPDGNTVAYSSDHNGGFEIYVKALTPGAREVQLTSDGGQNFQPAWSPNGQQIAFHSRVRGGIWVMPAAGGEAKQLTDVGTYPAWSPDGKLIAFQSYPLTDLGAGARTALPPSTIWTVATEGGDPTQITRIEDFVGGQGAPSWSPDGKNLLFEVDDYNLSSVYSLSLGGNNARMIVRNGRRPVYSPDGKSIVFINNGVEQVQIDPETGEPVDKPSPISGNIPFSRGVSFSANGKKMAYNTLSRSERLASIILRSGSNEADGAPAALVQKVSGRIHQPAFSPDGKRFAFTSCLFGATGCDIWLSNLDGTNQTQLTTVESNEMMASWFPNQSEIAYISDRTGHWTLWSINLMTRRERMLLDMKDDLEYCRLSPDGKKVIFNFKRNSGVINIWSASLERGEPKQLTFDKELMGFPAWSHDGKYIAFQMKRGDDTHLMVMPAEGGTPTQLTFEKGQSWAFDWSPDDDKILFAGFRNGKWNVFSYSLSTKREQQLTDYGKLNAFVRYPAWSPKGNQIIYEYSETTGNVWVADLK
jgi:Tol biopolymer transport system component/serine/threonine protein kinase